MAITATNAVMFAEGPKERIRDKLTKVEFSMSSYDTAWVAMVPSSNSPQSPCFPKCLHWLLENQHLDGSWGLPSHIPSLMKDSLSSTLASVLALKQWNIGEEQMNKGIQFIKSNVSFATDENQHSPIGFNIIFPGMIGYANDLGLHLPLSSSTIDDMMQKRDLELKRCSTNFSGNRAYLAYVSEGLGKLQDWTEIMKFQRKNGSLFNSPSTTAAALMHGYNAKGLDYLWSLVEMFGNAVPTAYPLRLRTCLSLVDNVERLGIARHFRDEIKSILDETYRCWLQDDDEIFLDTATCAMAFRLLRIYGYNVSSDVLAQLDDKDPFFNSVGESLQDIGAAAIELYRASQVMIFSNELGLKRLNSLASHILKQQLSSRALSGDILQQHNDLAVENTLKFPMHADLERIEHRRTMESFRVDSFQILKSAYRIMNIDNKDFLELAVEDFQSSQLTYREELKNLERWVKENRLDQLKFARQKLTYCYFSAAATLFPPELSDARIPWAKNGVLTTVVDDFFDVGGSQEEMIQLIELVEKWDGDVDCCSEQVEIIFSALYNTINDLGTRASSIQGRSVTSHIVEIWLALVKSMMRESEWLKNNAVPTLDDYMINGCISFALGPIVLPTLYFVGPEISEDVIRSPEYSNLFKLMSTCGRILNDVQGFEREGNEGKLNSVSLLVLNGHGKVSVEDAKREMGDKIDHSRRELLRLVLQTEGSVVPRECKDLFWKMSKILHVFYMRNDGFTSPKEMLNAVNAVIYEPLNVTSV
ncbi:hypothetical protein QJS10_CPB11g01670 [Acorus calamus]|uniref:Ent-kaurene synthase n=1 Tax=Acorus calamus TaxID=4465 RepID=A0AAV9DUV2_ACOCL|nr:hypothetical protein QJS10_CPB11g01670 [Acorus calamus]